MASEIKAIALLCIFGCYTYKALELSSMSMVEIAQLNADTLETQYRNCVDQGDDFCRKLEYVTKLNAKLKKSPEESEKSRRIREVSALDNETGYQNVFENYILKNRYNDFI